MKIKDFFKNYTCASGTEIRVYLPREIHNMTIVEALDEYGESEIVSWRLLETKHKVIVIEINS